MKNETLIYNFKKKVALLFGLWEIVFLKPSPIEISPQIKATSWKPNNFVTKSLHHEPIQPML